MLVDQRLNCVEWLARWAAKKTIFSLPTATSSSHSVDSSWLQAIEILSRVEKSDFNGKLLLTSNSVCEILWACLNILMHPLQKDAACCCLGRFICKTGQSWTWFACRSMLCDTEVIGAGGISTRSHSVYFLHILYIILFIFRCLFRILFQSIFLSQITSNYYVITSSNRIFLTKATLWEPSRPKHFSPKTERLGSSYSVC